MDIRFVPRDEIEKSRWDGCVHYAPNGFIYGYTWYLDNVAENWDGLVEGNYESVFPLVWNKKMFGIKQIYQPYLCQQLGVYSMNACSKPRLQAFLDAIPKEYKFIGMNMNDRNNLVKNIEGLTNERRSNYLLALNRSYEEIRGNYSTNLKRNIAKGKKHDLYITAGVKPEKFVDALRAYHEEHNKGLFPEQIYHTALRIIYNCLHRGLGNIMGIYLNGSDQFCAAIFQMYSGSRIINLLNVTTNEGRKVGAMHFLMDEIIQQNAGRPVVYDFEGSNIESIARFYKSFGAADTPYFSIEKNNLPWWIRWYKNKK